MEKMILKIVLPLLVLSIFGDYAGVQCIKFETTDEKLYDIQRRYDIMHFLDYGTEEFDTHNRQCYLAFLIYTTHTIHEDVNEHITDSRIDDIHEFSVHINRVMNIEFTLKLKSKTFILHDKIKVWAKNKKSTKCINSMIKETKDIIELGINNYIWKTEKELELLLDYRNYFVPTKYTEKAFETCLNNLRHLGSPTDNIGKLCSNKEYKIVENTKWTGKVIKKTILRDFGALTLFLVEDEYRTLQFADDNKSTNLYILEYLEEVLIEIIQGIVIVLSQVDFGLPRIPEVYEFPYDTNIQVELLIILRHLYLKTADTTQDLYILIRRFENKTSIAKHYKMLSVYFQSKWTSLFTDAPQIKKNISPNFKLPSVKRQERKSKLQSLFSKETAADIKKHLEARYSEFDDEIDDTLNEKRFGEFEQINESRFYQDRRVQPSSIRLYSVFNESWNNDIPNETNINQMKVFLYDVNGILTIVKRYVYSLTVASYSTQKKKPSYDIGYINGCYGPHTGPLKFGLSLMKDFPKEKMNIDLMEELESAKIFFERFDGNIQSKNIDSAKKLFGGVD